LKRGQMVALKIHKQQRGFHADDFGHANLDHNLRRFEGNQKEFHLTPNEVKK
jgi:hypothetical protein